MFLGAEYRTFFVKCHFRTTKYNFWLFLAIICKKWPIFVQGDFSNNMLIIRYLNAIGIFDDSL